MGESVEVAARGPTEQRHERCVRELGDLTDRIDPDTVKLCGRHRPDTPQSLDWKRLKEGELAVRGYFEQTVGLGHSARNLGEVLRPRDADGDRQPNPFAHLSPQADGDLPGSPGEPSESANVEERLVDRQPLHERRGGRTPDRASRSPRRTRTCVARPRLPPGTGDGPPPGSSRCGCHTPSPRSSERARLLRRRAQGGRAAEDHLAARPPRRTRRRRHARSSPCGARTYVRTARRYRARTELGDRLVQLGEAADVRLYREREPGRCDAAAYLDKVELC